MKKILFVAIIVLVTACSSSKYAANFHYYKSNTGLAGGYDEVKPRESVIAPIQSETLVASANKETALMTEKTPLTTAAVADQVRKTYFQMNKAERKSLRKELKTELKKYTQLKKNNNAAASRQWWKGWDQDLKLAAIFGAIGTVAIIIYTEPFFVIGAVALIIGLVFLIKWFVRQ